MRTRRATPLILSVALAGAGLLATSPSAAADGPGSGTPYVVTVGDSYISGEAGRWAGSRLEYCWLDEAETPPGLAPLAADTTTHDV